MQKLMHLVVIVGIGFIIGSSGKPEETSEKIVWLSIAEAQVKFAKEKRPILVDLYTEWCGWCKVMDKKTYNNKNVADYLSSKFYIVKMDAEGRDNITWNGKVFKFDSKYKTHELAIYFTGGRLVYPTTIIIPADGSQPQAIPGYLEPKTFEPVVKYFGEGKYGVVPFKDFEKSFAASW